MELKNKVVVITGASRGIGKATALEFAKEGSKLVLAARSKEELEETKNLITDIGSQAMVIVTDVTKDSDIKQMYDIAEKEWGQVDIAINNAGVIVVKPLIKHSNEDFENVMEVNVKGVFFSCREAAKRMNDNGIIINISSDAGKMGIIDLSIYCASKFAVIGLSESLAKEFKGKVFAVCPGPTNTDMYRSSYALDDYSQIDQPQDIGKRIVSLCKKSDQFQSGIAVDIWKPI